MKCLHITSWYPNLWNNHEALFIKEQFNALNPLIDQELWHIQVRQEGSLFKIMQGDYSDNEHYLIIDTKIKIWRIIELLTLLLLLILRVKFIINKKNWTLTHFHIAYPLLRFPKIIKYLFGRKLLISEHWSAYKLNFNIPKNSKASKRIQNIFSYGIPVIIVSKALMNDIQSFSSNSFPKYIVPNVVPTTIFKQKQLKTDIKKITFLMVASWAPIKKPLLIMQAFSELVKTNPSAQLRIIGYGHQWLEMQKFVTKNELGNYICLLGKKDKSEISKEMREASAFLHASDYETFSVVCAEALCCGTPVIASKVGGIPEFIDEYNGILVENDHASWSTALQSFVSRGNNWNNEHIAKQARAQFDEKAVATQLLNIYRNYST